METRVFLFAAATRCGARSNQRAYPRKRRRSARGPCDLNVAIGVGGRKQPHSALEAVEGRKQKRPSRLGFGGVEGDRGQLAVGGSAIVNALNKVIDKGRKIAAHLLEAAEGDIVFENGAFQVKGTDRKKTFAEIALTAYVPHKYPIETIEPGLEETAFYDPKNFTYPAGTYVCEVEIDPATGQTEVASFTAADDFGNIVNPMIVEGQVHGGLVQGIGQALLENTVYDDNGQLKSGSYMD